MISIIIPIFNCELYIKKAINSVLIQKNINEILIIDDGSTDGSYQICEEFRRNYNFIKLFQHPDKKNHGRSKTRNLGIKKAKSIYIAFLDADDFYLPNRFENDLKLFKEDDTIDGVYNAIGSHFYRKTETREKERLKLTTVSEKIDSKELFEKMGPMGHFGYFSGIGLTVKRDAFLKTGFFNENLQVAEDTELWLRMALVLKLVSGIIDKPVVLRGIHNSNVSFVNDDLYKVNNLKMYRLLLDWMFQNDILFFRINKIWRKIWIQHLINKTGFFVRMNYWFKTVFSHPILLKSISTYKYFPLIRLFKR